jgi:hypothetical protein
VLRAENPAKELTTKRSGKPQGFVEVPSISAAFINEKFHGRNRYETYGEDSIKR